MWVPGRDLQNYQAPEIASAEAINAVINATDPSFILSSDHAAKLCGSEGSTRKRCRLPWPLEWTRRVPGTDCMELSHLPNRTVHVVGVSPGEENKHPLYLNHVILFP